MTLIDPEISVELGLPDGPLCEEEQKDPFVSKIGGKPAWLFSLPERGTDAFCCGICGSQMYLLLQFDSPLPNTQDTVASDRVIYVFACNTRTCTESGDSSAIRVIIQVEKTKIQKPTSGNPPKNLWDTIMNDVSSEIASVTLNDSKKLGFYSDQFPVSFPATSLHIVEELIAVHKKPPKQGTASLLPDDLSNNGEGGDWQPEVYEKMHVTGYDKNFKNFHKRVSHYPNQCVRYSPKEKPLYFNSDELPVIPPCSSCGKDRSFELQIMPAVLSILPVGKETYLKHIPKNQRNKHPLFGDSMEWGTIMIYSCGSCTLEASTFTLCQFDGFAVVQIEKDS